MDSGLQEDAIRHFPYFPCTSCCHFHRFRTLSDYSMLPCAQDISHSKSVPPVPFPHCTRTLSHASTSRPFPSRTIIIHRVLSRVSFCVMSVRIPHHYHVLYICTTSASSPSISGLIITIIPFALLTSHFMLPTMSLTGDSQYLKSVPDVGYASSLGR